jgi:RNA-directed DNA polymerase
MESFGRELDGNIDLLWQELRAGRFRATDVRRTWIPKGGGKLRPLGIPTVRDRVVQKALHTILSAVFEPCFLELSHGFRPGRSAHNALDQVKTLVGKCGTSTVVDADIEGFFDAVHHQWLMKFLEHRIADRTILHLVGKFLHVGVMDRGVKVRNEDGVPQGGPLSPLLANIYLHYVLDLWFERRVQGACEGRSFLVRYADDFVAGFAHRGDAEQFLADLGQRLSEFGLKLSQAKTRLVDFGPRSPGNGTGPGPTDRTRTFDFLGFTHYMRALPKRGFRCAVKPSRKSRNRFLLQVKEWCRKVRDTPVHWQAKRLGQKLSGWYRYFGRRNCLASLKHMKLHAGRLWVMSLRRRSQRHRLWWHLVKTRGWFMSLPNPVLR